MWAVVLGASPLYLHFFPSTGKAGRTFWLLVDWGWGALHLDNKRRTEVQGVPSTLKCLGARAGPSGVSSLLCSYDWNI